MHGDLSERQFQELEEPLKVLDPALAKLAMEIGYAIEKNYHGQPSRRLIIEATDGTTKQISISPVIADSRGVLLASPVYVIAVFVWRDELQWRYSFHENIGIVPVPVVKEAVLKFVEIAWRKASVTDLSFLRERGEMIRLRRHH